MSENDNIKYFIEDCVHLIKKHNFKFSLRSIVSFRPYNALPWLPVLIISTRYRNR